MEDQVARSGGRSLRGRTMLISGGSRGIGLAIALRAARDGANVALLAKTAEPHPKLQGTIHTAAAEIEAAGGRALPIIGDVRDEATIASAVSRTAAEFGGIDICINNASALDLSSTLELETSKLDLMLAINVRGTFLLSRECIPHLRGSSNPHILTLSPPIDLSPHWAGAFLGYTVAKYGMSLTTLGLAEELAADGIAVNSLWPRTTIDTAAVRNLIGEDIAGRSRGPQIMADAAHHVLTSGRGSLTGRFLIDEGFLRERGVSDFSIYGPVDDADLQIDYFVSS